MENDFSEPINLRDFLKNSELLNPFKEHYPDYLKQFLQKTLDFWESDDLQKALEQIQIFNSHFEEFQIGNLIELSINLKNLNAEKTLKNLNNISVNSFSDNNLRLHYHFVKAVLYFKLWDVDESKNECDQIIKINPSYLLAYYLRGTCFALRSLNYSAIADLKMALKGNYKSDEIKTNLAYCYLRTGKIRKAHRLNKEVAPKFPKNDKIQYTTGISFKRFKKYKKAVEYFDKAILLKPNIPGYKLTRARVLMKLNRHQEAEDDLLMASKAGMGLAKELLKINQKVLQGVISSRKANKMVVDELRRVRNGRFK